MVSICNFDYEVVAFEKVFQLPDVPALAVCGIADSYTMFEMTSRGSFPKESGKICLVGVPN